MTPGIGYHLSIDTRTLRLLGGLTALILGIVLLTLYIVQL